MLNKVQLHIDDDGVMVAIAPQGLFTPAAARPVLTLLWSQITTLSATNAQAGQAGPVPRRAVHFVVRVLTMRLDLPDQLVIGTPSWTMTVGVRVAADELRRALKELLAGHDGPTPALAS